jgi:hypothetical protein
VTMFVYQTTDPIDFWEGWQSESEYLAKLCDSEPRPDQRVKALLEYIDLRCKAEHLARSTAGQGHIRCGPYIAALPSDGGSKCPIMIAFKQTNNGTTFIISPYQLPWLKHGDRQLTTESRAGHLLAVS